MPTTPELHIPETTPPLTEEQILHAARILREREQQPNGFRETIPQVPDVGKVPEEAKPNFGEAEPMAQALTNAEKIANLNAAVGGNPDATAQLLTQSQNNLPVIAEILSKPSAVPADVGEAVAQGHADEVLNAASGIKTE